AARGEGPARDARGCRPAPDRREGACGVADGPRADCDPPGDGGALQENGVRLPGALHQARTRLVQRGRDGRGPRPVPERLRVEVAAAASDPRLDRVEASNAAAVAEGGGPSCAPAAGGGGGALDGCLGRPVVRGVPQARGDVQVAWTEPHPSVASGWTSVSSLGPIPSRCGVAGSWEDRASRRDCIDRSRSVVGPRAGVPEIDDELRLQPVVVH
ncbi:unnamed protein product, partial [Prorocentrum cordatum]